MTASSTALAGAPATIGAPRRVEVAPSRGDTKLASTGSESGRLAVLGALLVMVGAFVVGKNRPAGSER